MIRDGRLLPHFLAALVTLKEETGHLSGHLPAEKAHWGQSGCWSAHLG